jgi:Ca-activated chloride channel family protein
MSFAAPLHLAALALLPLLALAWAAARRRRRRAAVRHPGAALVAGVAAVAPRWPRRVAPALLGLAAVTLALALARPQATVAVPVARASVMLVTDASGSMEAEDVEPSRLRAAQDAAGAFLDRVPDGLLVGAVSYADGVGAAIEPTTDHDRVRAALDALVADGGTATGDALNAALDRLEARRGDDGAVAPAAIVLLSDGETTQGSDPLAAADRAARLRIPVFTVALGTPDGVIVGPQGEQVRVPPDPETLRRIAERSGGEASAVEDAGELDRVYEGLGSRIGTREERREVTVAFAGGGLLLLLGALAVGVHRRGALL